MSSLNKLNAAKIIRRPDTGPVIRLSALRVQDGFNERTPGPELEAHIEALKRHKLAGGTWPPILISLEDKGGLVRDGHCRTEATRRALAEDSSIADADGEVWMRFDVFTGNDAEAVAAIAQTNAGLKLAPLELGRVYKRLAAFDWPVSRIATSMQKSEEHIRQMLLLANANTDIQRMVQAGTVSAAEAVKAVRKRGAEAGQELAARLEAAQAKGNSKLVALNDGQLFKALERGVTVTSFDAATGEIRLQAKTSNGVGAGDLRSIAKSLAEAA
ncbi:hypothetical protein GT347_20090 [Xylophilus rhododendri]|uniref:ParB/Sulfiredoxin domain-containing protein n=1 Tax=Xylophilus rhododendri TaxID=2697032 RepID=A0A857JBI8_9BURK|nr:hypothetical protein [Xylophilus rhododendri]QHJ00076.1 hypothetical protein GT347_20090 [Xylophilus rhododendri]